MSTSTLYRLSGLALMAALPLQIVGFVLHPPGEVPRNFVLPEFTVAHVILLVSGTLAMLGFIAMYVRITSGAGALGLVGFVLTMISFQLLTVLLMFEAFGAPQLARDPSARYLVTPPSGYYLSGDLGFVGRSAAGVAGILGPILFGIAMLRTRVFQRWAGICLIAYFPASLVEAAILVPFLGPQAPFSGGVPSGVAPVALGYYVLYIGFAWAGYTLWKEDSRRVQSLRQ